MEEEDEWFWIRFFGVILILSFLYSYYLINSNAKYAIATTTGFYIGQRPPRQINYVFYIEGEKFKGSCPESKNDTVKVKVPDGKYLVVYAVSDPKINILLVDKPILVDFNLDSLNEIGVDKNEIDWTEL